MFTKSHAVTLAILVAAHVWRVRHIVNRDLVTFEKINEINKTLSEMHQEAELRVVYMARLLEEHGIELDEFDIIALNNLTAE